jgi:hypothetical protein
MFRHSSFALRHSDHQSHSCFIQPKNRQCAMSASSRHWDTRTGTKSSGTPGARLVSRDFSLHPEIKTDFSDPNDGKKTWKITSRSYRQELENRQQSVGKLGPALSMPLILARLSRHATCHLDCQLRLQLAHVLRDRGRARPSLPELSQLPRYAIRPCSQFMKHAREGKVAIPQWIFRRNERHD